MIVPITDPADPRIAAYHQVRERDLVGRVGQFIAEGEVVLRALVTSPLVRPLSLLIAEHRLARVQGLVERAPDETPVFVAAQGVIDHIAGFPLHRGLLGLGERVDVAPAEMLLRQAPDPALVVVLFGIGNHDNMGGIFRNVAAFGAQAVLLDPTCCDPLYRKSIRVSVGAVLRTPFARWAPDVDPVDLLESQDFTPLALSPAGTTALARLERPRRAAVLLGSEGPGLPPDVLARVRTVSIAMQGGFDSLNVATTSGIVLHHLAAD